MSRPPTIKQKTDVAQIGLYGGSFDPIHNAHLIIAQFIKEELDLDKIVFIPSASPPHKKVFSKAQDRLEMVRLSIQDNPNFECSEVEIHKQQICYSIDTIQQLKQELNASKERLFWIIGSDNFVDFDKWKHAEKILEMCNLVVFPRNREDFDQAPGKFRRKARYIKGAPLIEISSTSVRFLIAEGRSIKYFVPRGVEELIRSKRLYL